MILTRLFQRYAVPALLTLGLALWAGCSDQMLTETPSANMTTDEPATSNSKLRYAHLVAGYDDPHDTTDPSEGPSKRVLERFEDLQTDTDFIVGLSDTVLEPQRVLERYEETPGVTVNRSFEEAYPGFSVFVEEGSLDDFLNQVGTDSDVRWVEPDPTIVHSSGDPEYDYDAGEYLPWGIDQIDAEFFAQYITADGATVEDYTPNTHVFVLDSGISSPDVNVCETRSFVGASDSEATDAAEDPVGHGTHIAGTIGALDNGEGIQGVAPNVCLHDYRVMNGEGKTMLSTVVDAVDHITQLKQQHPNASMVVNISLGADVGSAEYNALDEAIDVSIDAGVTYVIAAGNDAVDARTVTPAHVEAAITVGAHDEQARFAGFSNHGSRIDLVAPGVNIISLPNTMNKEAKLARYSGTSMAAGHVSGAAALYLALENPYASPGEVRSQLRNLSGHTVTGAPNETNATRLYLGNLFSQLTSGLTIYSGGVYTY